ncbi:MAG: Rrf2 family transcriptional regulator [Dictyoglomus sp.]|nr:Rrf2 family transcriptional regulator [Dictyoglomus sp.]MCX7942616.1 Rrf2 family transcriptional regulator [Dictyoglomaceae bacterium]MDW8188533.1 Rrf2 family transcriptional regulator [Dictyoglomus sp.]
MKLSTRSRYGLRALIYLANNQEKSPISVRTIAQNEEIPLRYLERIMRILSQKGFVKAEVGAEGGYSLNRRPEDISVFEVIEALEGRITLVLCIENGSKCKRAPTCLTRPLWKELNDAMKSVLKKYTLKDFIASKESLEV